MNSYLLIFSIFLLIVLVTLIVFLIFLSLKFVGKKEIEIQNLNLDQDYRKSPFCKDHPEILSEGYCSVDGESYCEQCLTRSDDIKIARKNLDEYLNYTWIELGMFKNSQNDHDFRNRILKVKNELYKNKKIPLIVRGHFKINVEDDSIENYTTLMCREDDRSFMKKELSFIKL